MNCNSFLEVQLNSENRYVKKSGFFSTDGFRYVKTSAH